jgi:hypothetical protein
MKPNRGHFAFIGLLAFITGVSSAQMPPMSPMPQADKGMPEMGWRESPQTESAPPDVQRKIIELNIRFTRDNAQLTTDVATARMELEELWLDDNPSADRIVAKMQDLDKLELQLRENEVRRRLAICKLLPADLRRGFLRMHAGKGTAGPGMRKRRKCI